MAACLIQAVEKRDIKADSPQGGGISSSRLPLALNCHIDFCSGEHEYTNTRINSDTASRHVTTALKGKKRQEIILVNILSREKKRVR